MNRTTDNTTLLSCGIGFFPINPSKMSDEIQAVFIVRIAVNALTCPLIILLNILVMVAVKTKQQLRTTSNVALACLATTDLVVGLVSQPLQITSNIMLFQSETDVACSAISIARTITPKCVWASIFHLFIMSTERYLAIKHTFVHENQVTKVRIMIASGLAWTAAIILPIQDLWSKNRQFLTILVPFVIIFIMIPAMIYFNIAIYLEVRRSDRQIAANQVSLEAKEKILKNKKAFYTTIIVLLFIFLCYVPVNICIVFLISFRDKIPANIGHCVFFLVSLLPTLNSLFNPLIYVVRLRSFRVAFIQLLARKTLAQAEELERNIFGPRQIGVTANVEQGQNRADPEENEQQGSVTMNNGHEQNSAGQEENDQQGNETLNNVLVITVRTQQHEEYEETPL